MGAENVTSVREFILMGLTNHRKTQILLFVVILIIYSLTVLVNLTIIILVRVDSRLQTPMYYFLTHLSCLEICYVTSTLPQMMAHLLAGNGRIPVIRCMLQMNVALTMGGAECLLLGAMAYDRYMAICHPLIYTIAMDRWCQLQLVLASWTIPFVVSVIYVVCTFRLPFCGPNHVNHFFCEVPVVLKLACADTQVTEAIVFGLAALVVAFPLLVILNSYGLILHSVLHMRSTAHQRKAFSTCASHLLVVTMFYGTVISMYMIPHSDSAPDRDKQIAVFYVVVTPLLNPIIYTLRNKDVHGAVALVLRRWGFEQKT
ncbi:olfactory receptor 2D3-like [Elgaria multicarinata webbii]|uniref:olfactory receptor 2D3-like n=1 Tax=Elgaria multicarinata webbii TaxID=159646 RepID=UPI002FCD2106